MKIRCEWCTDDELYEAYHDEEWGVPCRDGQRLLEFLILEGAQAGLSWITVLRKRENYRSAFARFDPEAIAVLNETERNKLLLNKGIIRNRLKIDSAINNAQRFLDIEASGSFSEFVWSFVDGRPKQNRNRTGSDVPKSTPESEVMSKAMKKAGFTFVGPTTCYAYMQATGMVNDHLLDCFRHRECMDLSC